jgi:mRNA interferase HigB
MVFFKNTDYLKTRYNLLVYIISKKALQQFWERYPDSRSSLLRWYKIVQKMDFSSFDELRQTFPSADKVGDFIVFNIGGNKNRLIAAVHFNGKKLFIRHVLSHAEYDRGSWKYE